MIRYRRSVTNRREQQFASEPAPDLVEAVDDSLWLYFLCAHPSLTPSSAIALTLRAVAGLTTRQIADAYLVPEATMAQRISRAKQKLAGVRRSISQAMSPPSCGSFICSSMRAIRAMSIWPPKRFALTRRLSALRDEPEVRGAALMLIHHARRSARIMPSGRLIPLADQDRSRWDTAMIATGIRHSPGGARP
ncbi:MAG: DUF6596 domain-containing protein [Thermomicrobiales bacterium]